ncbi:MAG: fibronectin type III domain-containing protein [Muribaculaceae bacterium]|nr:fibronectin type III domain-containing protein [Muribaculaceae bacterium]
MKLRFIVPALALFGAAVAAPGAEAQVPMLKPMARPAVAKAAEASVETLVDENFSRMTAGSEDAPDSEYIADKRTGVIPSAYTAMPGWTGAAVYQAGGTCAIRMGRFTDGMGGVTYETGFLRTPQGAYSGDVTLTFRARLLASQKASDKMDIALLNDKGRLEAAMVDVTPEWKSFTVNFTKGEFSGCLIQMSMLEEEVLIDDIKVTARQTAIPAPVASYISDYREDGFTAHWERVAQADSYALTIYEKKVAEAITIEDFDNLNQIDGTNMLDKNDPGFTEGWTVAYGLVRNTDHVSPLGYEGSTGMVFRTTGEGFITPEFDRPILDFSFYAVHPSGEECLSTLVVSVLVDGQWGALGNYDVERISDEGEIIRLSSNFPEGVKAVQVYFKKNDMYDAGKDVSVIIDHIRIMTEPEPVAIRKDIPTTELSYVVSGLDPLKDYSFTVRALNEGFTSAESNELTASGLAAPELLDPAAQTVDGYTAAWAATPKAEGYVVSNYRVYTVSGEYEEVDILSENFNKVTEGTVDSPVGLYNVVNPKSLDAYTTNPGWMGIATYLANGMIGTRSYMGIMGIIQTPALDLSGNGGNFSVRVRVVGDTDATDEFLVVQAGYEEYIALPMKAGESVDLTFDFSCGQAGMPLAFYSYNGFPFYIDEVTVTQTLPYGSKVYTEVENRLLDDSSARTASFGGLRVAPNENYAYRVFAYRDFMGSRVFSLSNGLKNVYLSSGIDAVDAAPSEGSVQYFRIDGTALPEAPTAPGLYIRRSAAGAEKILVK